MGRIVGLDVGERRVGVAVSDVTRTLARPVRVLTIQGLGRAAIHSIVQELDALAAGDDPVTVVVVGLPRRLDGTRHPRAAAIEAFGRQLQTAGGREVVFHDERLSSREAESRLAVREKDWRVRKARLDAAAAAVILQDYLDARPASRAGAGAAPE